MKLNLFLVLWACKKIAKNKKQGNNNNKKKKKPSPVTVIGTKKVSDCVYLVPTLPGTCNLCKGAFKCACHLRRDM